MFAYHLQPTDVCLPPCSAPTDPVWLLLLLVGPGLTLARTCCFPILERTWGVVTPHAISPLIEIELWVKDQTNPWDVLSPMVPELTSLGHILTPPGREIKKIAI